MLPKVLTYLDHHIEETAEFFIYNNSFVPNHRGLKMDPVMSEYKRRIQIAIMQRLLLFELKIDLKNRVQNGYFNINMLVYVTCNQLEIAFSEGLYRYEFWIAKDAQVFGEESQISKRHFMSKMFLWLGAGSFCFWVSGLWW